MEFLENARRSEMERALRRLRAGHDAREVTEALSRRLTNKLLHRPMRALREKGCDPCTSTS